MLDPVYLEYTTKNQNDFFILDGFTARSQMACIEEESVAVADCSISSRILHVVPYAAMLQDKQGLLQLKQSTGQLWLITPTPSVAHIKLYGDRRCDLRSPGHGRIDCVVLITWPSLIYATWLRSHALPACMTFSGDAGLLIDATVLADIYLSIFGIWTELASSLAGAGGPWWSVRGIEGLAHNHVRGAEIS